MFRNDWAFSVAVHEMNGRQDRTLIPRLPIPSLLKTFDSDDIAKINSINDITFLVQKPNKKDQYLLTRIKDVDVHVMNKFAISRVANELLELYN
jgi:hypothetical protein